ncbi:MAG: hypothetical protein K2I11_09940 [Bacteroides sp.]|nr:hypothetical protein [Bacteroides sp.]
MKTTYIPLLLLLALMTSCSYDFDLKGMDAAEKLVLYCICLLYTTPRPRD